MGISKANDFIKFVVDTGLLTVDMISGEIKYKGEIPYLHPAKDGYLRMKRIDPRDGKLKEIYAHRIVAYVLYGDELFGDVVVDHINGINNDNRPDNIQLMSNSGNVIKASRMCRGWFLVVRDGKVIATVKIRRDAEIVASALGGEVTSMTVPKPKRR